MVVRALQILVAAIILGLAAGYAWSAAAPRTTHVRIPKPPQTKPIVIPESQADKAWIDRSTDNAIDENNAR